MKAAVLHGKELIKIEDLPTYPLQAGEVRIGIRAALTCGTDLKVFKRGYHARMIIPPSVFGHELAGVISEVHPGVSSWKVGDRVVVANSAPCGACFYCQHHQENLCDDLLFLNGAYAESIVIPARLVQKNLLPLKSSTSFRDAALTEPLACVVRGIEDAQLKAGLRVLILGSGPIGLMFVALGRAMDCDVTVAGRGQSRLQIAQKLGARKVFEIPRGSDLVGVVQNEGGTLFDIVIEAVGKPETWAAAVQLVRKGGLINLFGGCPSGTNVALDTARVHYSSLIIVSSFHHTPRAIRRALEFIEKGVVRADDFVDGEWRLTQLPELFRIMASGNHAVKTLVRVQD